MKRLKRWRMPILVVFLAGFLGVGYWLQGIGSRFVPEDASILDKLGAVREVLIDNPREQFPGREKFTVLLAGRDYNHNRKSIAYTTNSRADTIMLLQCDLEKQTVTGVSIPRDTKVTSRDGITGKINATLARGGIDLLSDTVEDLTGVKPDYTVLIKADAVREIVNAVGGVEVETIDEMHYDDHWGDLHIHLPKGRQVLNGEQAVGFTRFREVNTTRKNSRGYNVPIKVVHSKEEGDARRMARQQQLIKAIANSAKAPKNWLRIGEIIDVSFNQLDTNFNKMQLAALAQIFKGSSDNIKTATLMGGEENDGVYYFLPDVEKTKALVDWLFNDNEYAGRQLVRVAVYNATDIKGAARVTAERLEAMMYDAFSGGNTKAQADLSTVVYRTAAVESRARDLAKSLGITSISKATDDQLKIEHLGSNEPDVYVTIGKDLADQIVAARSTSTVSSERPLGG